MQGFEYSYKTSEEILGQMPHISDFSVIQLTILGIVIFITVFFALVLIPGIFSIKSSILEGIDKKRKKQMLHQIMIQKEIETQIEEEIKQDEEKKIAQTI